MSNIGIAPIPSGTPIISCSRSGSLAIKESMSLSRPRSMTRGRSEIQSREPGDGPDFFGLETPPHRCLGRATFGTRSHRKIAVDLRSQQASHAKDHRKRSWNSQKKTLGILTTRIDIFWAPVVRKLVCRRAFSNSAIPSGQMSGLVIRHLTDTQLGSEISKLDILRGDNCQIKLLAGDSSNARRSLHLKMTEASILPFWISIYVAT